MRILTVPYHYLFPAVLMFICLGTYSVNYSIVDILLVAGFGLGGYILRAFYYPMAPLILGFVLGPLIEQNFRRAMLLSDGSFTTFIERPISLVILIITLALMLWGVWSTIKQKRKLKAFNTIKNAA